MYSLIGSAKLLRTCAAHAPSRPLLDPAVFVELIESGAGVGLGASTIANCYLPSRVHQVTSCERLEGNMIYRGASHSSNERTSIQRALDSASRNEQYVLVPDRNVGNLATQQSRQIYLLLLEPILCATKQSCFSCRGDVSRSPRDSYDLQDRDSSRGI